MERSTIDKQTAKEAVAEAKEFIRERRIYFKTMGFIGGSIVIDSKMNICYSVFQKYRKEERCF